MLLDWIIVSSLLKGFFRTLPLSSQLFSVLGLMPKCRKSLKVLGVGFGERPFFKRVLPNKSVDELSLVDYADSLALASWQGLRLDKTDLRLDTER